MNIAFLNNEVEIFEKFAGHNIEETETLNRAEFLEAIKEYRAWIVKEYFKQSTCAKRSGWLLENLGRGEPAHNSKT